MGECDVAGGGTSKADRPGMEFVELAIGGGGREGDFIVDDSSVDDLFNSSGSILIAGGAAKLPFMLEDRFC